FQAEDGIRDRNVTGVQTCALPISFVLLAGAGLLGLSLNRVLAVSPGFQPAHVLTGRLVLLLNNYREPAPRLAFIERLLGELKAKIGRASCRERGKSGEVGEVMKRW